MTCSNNKVCWWLFGWAALTTLATLPLLFLGAEVTTKQVGMVDSQGLRHPLHFLHNIMGEQSLGWMIEHGHRFAGWIVGNCVIVLAILLWLGEPRRWMRFLGLGALLLVITQGTLGIFRIELNAILGKTLALIHGSFAPIVFTTLASIALFTSPAWLESRSAQVPSRRYRRFTLVVALVVYAQLVLGGIVRHKDFLLSARIHLLGAFVVTGMILWLARLSLEEHGSLSRSVKVLLGLLALQLILGVETWLSKFFVASQWQQLTPIAIHPDLVRSLHYVVGTLTFATSVVVALTAYRNVVWAPNAGVSTEQNAELIEVGSDNMRLGTTGQLEGTA